MKKATILIVEDDVDILNANCAALKLEGYDVLQAMTLKKGREMVQTHSPDLVILDIMLPDGNGISYCNELRGESGVRIVFLSAMSGKNDVLLGLKAGGDDYITKPYDMDVLLMRVEALLRRGWLNKQEEPLIYGKLKLNHISMRAFIGDRDLLLKPKEFALLYILANNEGQLVSSEELYKQAWGMDDVGNHASVKEHISRIRRKLAYSKGIAIVAERGKGYRLVCS